MKKRPTIGVTGPRKGGLFAWVMTWLALKRAGARPLRLRQVEDVHPACLDGIVLGGGSDISPENYGEELLPITEASGGLKKRLWSVILFLLRLAFSVKLTHPPQDTYRDRMEKKLCRYALENRLPTLGICRGAQLINITLGGTLHQHTLIFYTETPHVRSVLPVKRVFLMKDGKLRKTIGADSCFVNSLHDQAVKKLGTGLAISAIDSNDIVQAIEHTKHPFMIGVQWHPEYLPHVKSQQKLFKALAETAKNRTR